MAFNYFKEKIGYKGQDLHVLRNSRPFPLHSFFEFPGGSSVSYNFKFPGSGNTRAYEQININISGNTAFIQADQYQGPDIRINNFYVTVSLNGASVLILIHLHDALANLWTTPNPLTFRKNQQVQFGLYAKFTGDILGDISFYPDIVCTKTDSNLTAVKVDTDNRLIIEDSNGTFPTPPAPYNDSFELSLPSYFQSSGPNTAKGSLEIRSEGSVQLVLGAKETAAPGDLDNRINLLFLADGFNGAAKSDEKTFIEYIRKIRAQMLSAKSSPWHLFGDRLNFWSYYEESKEGGGILGGEYLILEENSSDAKAISITKFVDLCDDILLGAFTIKQYTDGTVLNLEDYIGQTIAGTYGSAFADFIPWSYFGNATQFKTKLFPLLTRPSSNPNILTISQLCYVVGLPGADDLVKDLATKKAEWSSLGLMSAPYSIKIQGETITASDFYLHEFAYSLWLKLAPRVVLDMPDTSLGTRRRYDHRTSSVGFISGPTLDFGVSKFPDWTQFGKYISAIKYPNTSAGIPLGQQYYDSNGSPVFSTDDDIEVDGASTTIIKQLKDGNNVIVLNRSQKLGIGGINQHITTSSTLGSTTTKHTKHRIISSVYDESIAVKDCSVVAANASLQKPKSYKPKDITFNKLGQKAMNSAIHELSHNYLLDEYTDASEDLNTKSVSVKDEETAYVKDSNLQTEWSLLDVQNPPGVIIGDNIKWRYPRILKIGVASKDLETDGAEYKIELTKEVAFVQGEHVLLRRKKLFNAQYFHCTIESINTSDKRIINIKPVSGVTITVADFKKGCVLISPIWSDSTTFTSYKELVHDKIKERITALHTALVPEDKSPGVFNIQVPEINNSIPGMAEDPIKKFKNGKSRIVGLFAGGKGQISGYIKGLYHPTGFCIMRKTDISEPNYFCHVCRYIIVDAVDPTQHPSIDEEYGKNDYPEIN